MAQQRNGLGQRTIERIFLLFISVVLVLLFLNLYSRYQEGFKIVPQRLGNGTMVNLNAAGAAPKVKALLQNGFYYEDPRDVQFITSFLAQHFHTEGNTLD